MDLVTLIAACALSVEPKVMHALVWEQSGGEPWSFSVPGESLPRVLAAVELETSKSCQDLRHVQPPDAYGRVTSTPWPHRQTCDNVRNSTKKSQTAHHGLRSDDLGTNRLSTGPLLGDGAAAARPGERRCSTVSSPF
jgi:hypothetical protein